MDTVASLGPYPRPSFHTHLFFSVSSMEIGGVVSVVPTASLQTSADRLASSLSSLPTFLEAAKELLQIYLSFSCKDYSLYDKKIVTLVEIARKTLSVAGLPLYTFCSCHPDFLPLKSIYLNLLKLLRNHRRDFSIDLNARVQRLLSALSARFVVSTSALDANINISLLPEGIQCPTSRPAQPASEFGNASRAADVLEDGATTHSTFAMPPPSPSPSRIERSTDALRSPSLLQARKAVSAPFTSPITGCPVPLTSLDYDMSPFQPDPDIVSTLIRRTGPRRFGILCTAQKLNCRRERTGRAMAVRPASRQ